MSKKSWLRFILSCAGAVDARERFDGARKLRTLIDEMGELEWTMIVLSIETELKVDIPDGMDTRRAVTAAEFIERVAALPKVKDPLWNLNRFTMLVEAFLSHAESEPRKGRAPAAKKPAKKAAKPAAKKAAKAPAKKAATKPAKKTPARKR